MNRFLTRLLEDDDFQMKVAKRFAWGLTAYAALSVFVCEWIRLS